MRTLTRTIVLIVLLLTCIPLSAAPLSLITGTLDLRVLTDNVPSFVAYDIRGSAAAVQVSDSPTNGFFYLTDGTPLGLPAPAVPNSILLALNSTLTEYFFLGTRNLRGGGSGALLDGFYLAPGTPITDPALAYAANSVIQMDFELANLIPGDGVTVTEWRLVGVQAVPEPGTWLSSALGLLGVLAIHRRRMA